MKPLGVTAQMRVSHPSRAEDAIWNAVQEAIAAGWTVKQFRHEAAEAWESELHGQARDAAKDWAQP